MPGQCLELRLLNAGIKIGDSCRRKRQPLVEPLRYCYLGRPTPGMQESNFRKTAYIVSPAHILKLRAHLIDAQARAICNSALVFIVQSMLNNSFFDIGQNERLGSSY